jgi:Na+-transporting methylmalonyl-CoA/oxaloacetate decarboxylase gamma subunit
MAGIGSGCFGGDVRPEILLLAQIGETVSAGRELGNSTPAAILGVCVVVLALVIVVLARYIMKLQDSRHEATLGHATLMKEMAKEHARELAAANEQHLAEIRAAHAEVVAKLDSLAACGTALSGAAEAMESAVDAMDHAKATFRESLTPLSNPAPSGRGQGKRNT